MFKMILNTLIIAALAFTFNYAEARENIELNNQVAVTDSSDKQERGLAINTASAEEIADVLPGVGEKKAQAIVAYREKNGAFQSAEELEAIKGIGPKLRAKISEKINFTVIED